MLGLRISTYPLYFFLDPWAVKASPPGKNADPWAIQSDPLDEDDFEFDTISKNRTTPNSLMSPLYPDLSGGKSKKNDPLEFLGENKGLVNLDNLLPTASVQPVISPFGGLGGLNNSVPNPFQNVIQKPSINEMRQKQLHEIQTSGGLLGATGGGTNAGNGFGGGNGIGNPSTTATTNNNINNNPWSPIKNDQNPFFN